MDSNSWWQSQATPESDQGDKGGAVMDRDADDVKSRKEGEKQAEKKMETQTKKEPMTDQEKRMARLKVEVRGILISQQDPLDAATINGHYRDLNGKFLPWITLGFKTIEDLLDAMPDVAKRLPGSCNGRVFYKAVVEKGSEHISRMVQRQMVDKYKSADIFVFNGQTYMVDRLQHDTRMARGRSATVRQPMANKPSFSASLNLEEAALAVAAELYAHGSNQSQLVPRLPQQTSGFIPDLSSSTNSVSVSSNRDFQAEVPMEEAHKSVNEAISIGPTGSPFAVQTSRFVPVHHASTNPSVDGDADGTCFKKMPSTIPPIPKQPSTSKTTTSSTEQWDAKLWNSDARKSFTASTTMDNRHSTESTVASNNKDRTGNSAIRDTNFQIDFVDVKHDKNAANEGSEEKFSINGDERAKCSFVSMNGGLHQSSAAIHFDARKANDQWLDRNNGCNDDDTNAKMSKIQLSNASAVQPVPKTPSNAGDSIDLTIANGEGVFEASRNYWADRLDPEQLDGYNAFLSKCGSGKLVKSVHSVEKQLFPSDDNASMGSLQTGITAEGETQSHIVFSENPLQSGFVSGGGEMNYSTVPSNCGKTESATIAEPIAKPPNSFPEKRLLIDKLCSFWEQRISPAQFVDFRFYCRAMENDAEKAAEDVRLELDSLQRKIRLMRYNATASGVKGDTGLHQQLKQYRSFEVAMGQLLVEFDQQQ